MPKLLNEHLGARSTSYSRIVPQTVEEEEALDPRLAELQLPIAWRTALAPWQHACRSLPQLQVTAADTPPPCVCWLVPPAPQQGPAPRSGQGAAAGCRGGGRRQAAVRSASTQAAGLGRRQHQEAHTIAHGQPAACSTR